MLITICAILLSLTIFLFVRGHTDQYGDECWYMGGIFSAIVFVIAFVVMIFCIGSIATVPVIDQKITMYEEENTSIEESIDIVVQQYMDYEQDTYAEFKSESSITLVSLFPELKSDTLVQQQMELYIANNAKIKELKESKINIGVEKWWVYFGK